MGQRSLKLTFRLLLPFGAGLIAVASFAGCWKKSGDAVVLEKEHIAVREVTPTPAAQSSTPSAPTPDPSNSPSDEEEYKPLVLAEDEIMVGNYVMKKDARGTSRDPRASSEEQWIVSVQMVYDLRRFDVHTDQARFDRVKVGDRIKVSYRQGKYTGTVWHAEID